MRNVASLTSRLARWAATTWKAAGVDRNDLRVVAGLTLLGVGVGLHSVMIALIVLGSVVLALGLYGSMRGG